MNTIALFGGSMNPPGLHHKLIVEQLAILFDSVVVAPCGPRPDKATTNDIPAIHRAAMADLTFGGMSNVVIDLSDLEKSVFTRTYDLYVRYKEDGEVHIVVGSDLLEKEENGKSQIQNSWHKGEELWANAIFEIVPREGFSICLDNLPPKHNILKVPQNAKHFSGSSSDIRVRVFQHKSFADLVTPEVEKYIERYALYHGMLTATAGKFDIVNAKVAVEFDSFNTQAAAIAKTIPQVSVQEADYILVIGGDGTMLRAIRSHWRRRKPFIGLNAGHVGFLMNELSEDFDFEVFIQDQFMIRHSPMLYTDIISPDGSRCEHVAFGDVFTRSKNGGQAAWIEVSVDGEIKIPKLVSDGILVSTAAGSTAYARSMGAAPIHIESHEYLLVGNNVFSPAYWKSANLSQNSILDFKALDTQYRPIEVYVDGHSVGDVESMHVRISNIAAAELLFTKEYDLAKKLSRLQFP